MLSMTRRIAVKSGSNPHFPQENLEVEIVTRIPASIEEADAFDHISKSALEIVQDYYATQQANAARQLLAKSANPTAEACQEQADAVLTGASRSRAVEVSEDRLTEIMASGDVEALAAYLKATGAKLR